MSSSEASKPYIDATERSIELNFRSLEYQNDRLNKVNNQQSHTLASHINLRVLLFSLLPSLILTAAELQSECL